jgi:viroplasmin and RNaseH domain-containing protein
LQEHIPGVYTDWGEVEKQVNGFSGLLHKKFKDRTSAKQFFDKYWDQGHKEPEDTSEILESDPKNFYEDELPR